MLSRQILLVLSLALTVALVAGQSTPAPPELKRNEKDTNQLPPVDQQQQPNQQLNELVPANNNQSPGDDQGEPEGQPDFVPNYLRPGPHHHPLFGLFGGNLFETIRRQHQMMDHHFSNLEQEAAQGQEVQYFSRNGVSYVKTCTTKRV